MAKKKATRTIVGRNLTPGLLKELGAVGAIPATPRDFKPDGNWVNAYRIWTCHGYRESGNDDVGFLRIERVAGKSDRPFTLIVQQEVVQADGMLSIIDAEISCLKNALASPVKWRLSSRFTRPDGKLRGELSVDERAVIKGNILQIETGRRTLKRRVSSSMTSDWSLFEAVQRLEYNEESKLAFDLLEGLSLLKQDHRLFFAATDAELADEPLRRHGLVQIGSGILPSEYWVDERGRLLFVCSMNKAYILDENAENTIRRMVKQMRK